MGRAVTESSVEYGLVLERPTTGCDEWVEGGGGGIVTALFDASMAGDLPDGQNTRQVHTVTNAISKVNECLHKSDVFKL